MLGYQNIYIRWKVNSSIHLVILITLYGSETSNDLIIQRGKLLSKGASLLDVGWRMGPGLVVLSLGGVWLAAILISIPKPNLQSLSDEFRRQNTPLNRLRYYAHQ